VGDRQSSRDGGTSAEEQEGTARSWPGPGEAEGVRVIISVVGFRTLQNHHHFSSTNLCTGLLSRVASMVVNYPHTPYSAVCTAPRVKCKHVMCPAILLLHACLCY
jgi:hypothetical protein